MRATRIGMIIGWICFGLIVQSAAAADAAPLTAERMWRLARLAAPALAPDGASAVLAVIVTSQ